ncbi:MAG TPA: redoxin domain-containing protein [Phnomibacter sp.]|nr:redoxin domain-containing protein [Phnomibacter sp.]
MAIEIGQKAPAFTLYNTEKQEVSLESLAGQNVLILFFPLAFTSVCTKELCSVRDNIAFYNSSNAVVVGISVDSLYTLGRYKADQQLNFTLLSDFNKEVSAAYGALYDRFSYGMQGVSKRAAFVVGKTGNIAYAEVLESAADLPNFEAIQAVLADLD